MTRCFSSAWLLIQKVELHISEGRPDIAAHHVRNLASSASLMGLCSLASAAEAARTAVMDAGAAGAACSWSTTELRAALEAAEREWAATDVDPAQPCRALLFVEAPPPTVSPAAGTARHVTAILRRRRQAGPGEEEVENAVPRATTGRGDDPRHCEGRHAACDASAAGRH